MPASDTSANGALDRDGADVESIVLRAQRRDALHEATVSAVAEIARFVRQPWWVDEKSLRFDGRSLLVAAAALAQYERLTNPRLQARLGYEMRPWLFLADDVKARVRRARDACLADLASLGSVSRSKDLPAVRRALRMDAAEQTPEKSKTRQRYRDIARVVAANLDRRIVAFRRQLLGQGGALPGDTMMAIYAIVAKAFSAHGEKASPDTVRRAWIAERKVSLAFCELEKEFAALGAQVKALQPDQAAAAPTPTRPPRPQGVSKVKKSIDRALSRKR